MDISEKDIFDGSTPIPLALEQLRLRLLDLTGRNRLLNFKHTPGKSLQLVTTKLDETFSKLVGASMLKLCIDAVPEPTRDDWVERNGRMAKPEAKEHALNLGMNVSLEELDHKQPKSGSALALYFNEELGKHCRKLDREARLAIEETGANMLFLVFGFLEYPDSKDADRLFSAPLVCVPVKMDLVQEHRNIVFKISFTGEEIEENLSLREKLKRDYSIVLPDFPSDEDGIEGYLENIETEITKQPRWRVRRSMNLALLSFSNMLLVRDLDPDQWSDENGKSLLLDHPIIKRVFQGGSEPNSSAYAKEYDLDEMEHANYPLIFDADSSQHSAIVDVMEGKSLVIEGPPGTGKSQTITNVIAACLNAGKSVLFVAEKLAALQVVRSRLQMAGLDPFLLELHSNKTSKRQVLESISNRMSFRSSAPRDLDTKEASLGDKKVKLKEHAVLLNSQLGNQLGCTVHQILWRADRSRRRLGAAGDSVATIPVADAPLVNALDYERRLDQVRYLAKQFAEIGSFSSAHPYWGFYPENLAPNDDLKIGDIFNSMRVTAVENCDLTAQLRSRYDFRLDNSLTTRGIDSLTKQIDDFALQLTPNTALDILPRVFKSDAADQASSLLILKQAEDMLARIIELETETEGKVDHVKVQNSTFTHDDLKFVQKQGLADITVQELPILINRLELVINSSSESIRSLGAFFEEVGIGERGSSSALIKLKAIFEISCSSPMQCLYLRHDGLSSPNIVEVLDRGRAERDRLQAFEKQLEENLYLDQAPNDVDLRKWVLTLREGPTWYRFLQKPWRTALNGHRSLQRNKVKLASSFRLADLEKLTELRKAIETWKSSDTLSAATGGITVDFTTPLERFLELARWLNSANDKLIAADVDKTVFSPLFVKEAQIARFRAMAPEVSVHNSILETFDKTLKEILFNGPGWSEDLPWLDKLQVAKNLHERLKAVHSGLANAISDMSTLAAARHLIEASHKLRKLSLDLMNSSDIASLLGVRHTRYREDLGEITAAIRFGKSVLTSSLPPELKKDLWSIDAREVLFDLAKNLKEINNHWSFLKASFVRLSDFGNVDIEEWLKSDSGTEIGCELTRLRIEKAYDSLDVMVTWSQYVHARRLCHESGLDPFIYLLEHQKISHELLVEAFAFRFHASIAESLFRQVPALARFSGPVHSTVRQEFSSLDRELIQLRGKQISSKCVKSANPPYGYSGAKVADKTEMSLLEYLVPQQRPRVTVREMLRRAGESIRALKPCFMMGPQAVAQFLHAEPQVFDVVIMDEASQMRPEEAIGAVARGKQLIVVGDPKQLPPTSFFSRSLGEDDSQPQMAAVDAESILDVASSHFRPIRSLRWHYRSRHESLIAFSNEKFYRGDLVVFPSPYPRSRGLGVRSHYVAGAIYESQMNQMEAVRVVDSVVDHILHFPDQSLGIVALNIRQRDLIAELLEERLATVKSADAYRDRWSSEGFGLFVKNLENVQGDERDTIIISTTFGPPPGGTKPHQNFGPISQQGGWRRLNVLFTRAKSSVLLVTSLKDTDIVVGAGTPEGTKALRDYLLYASSGRLHYEPGRITGSAPESEFEESVINVLRDNGYECEPQVGVAGFRIDIGVKHPDYPHLFLAGIECDGASYHSGITVRDRDRIRQEILENLGWKGKLWRIWSTEWFRNSKSELRKLIGFLEDLKRVSVDPEIAATGSISDVSLVDDQELNVGVSLENVNRTAISLITEASEMEISIGDHVIYKDLTSTEPDAELAVLITKARTDLIAGIISESTPLAQVLLGAIPGEKVHLRIPGQRERILEIFRIKRNSNEEKS